MNLVTTHDAALHRFLARRLPDADSARDIANEAYVRLLRLEDIEAVRAPRAYLFRIASNVLYERGHRERRDVVTFDSRLADGAAQCVSDPRSIEPSERIELEERLECALARLPRVCAAIVLLTKRDGLSMPEVAHALDVSIHTVKKYLFRSIAHIRGSQADPKEPCMVRRRRDKSRETRQEDTIPHMPVERRARLTKAFVQAVRCRAESPEQSWKLWGRVADEVLACWNPPQERVGHTNALIQRSMLALERAINAAETPQREARRIGLDWIEVLTLAAEKVNKPC